MLSSLPDELLVSILLFLDPGELGIVAHTSRSLRRAALAASPSSSLQITVRAVSASPSLVAWAASVYPAQVELQAQSLLCLAAFRGRIDTVEAVLGLQLAIDVKLDSDVTAWASEGGCVAMLEFLVSRGALVDVRAAFLAALRGHLPALRWLWARHCPRGWITCAKAAEGGHLDILQWLRHRECPWNSLVTYFAAKKGHLDVLAWAINNGCPYNISDLETIAADSGNDELCQTVAYFRNRALNSAIVPVGPPT